MELCTNPQIFIINLTLLYQFYLTLLRTVMFKSLASLQTTLAFLTTLQFSSMADPTIDGPGDFTPKRHLTEI